MTEIDVPDWVGEIAAKAMADSIGHGMAEKCEKHALAALTAALGAWASVAGYMDPDDGSVAAEGYAHEPRYASYTVPLYTLRQEKPE